MRSLSLCATLVALMSTSFAFVGCEKPAPKKKEAPVLPMTVVKVEKRDIPDVRSYPGNTKAVLQANMVARVEGYLEKRDFKGGMDVKEGDLLFVIQQEPYEAKLVVAQAALLEAEVQVSFARTEYERNQPLAESGAISQQTWDGYVRNLESALAQFESAQADLIQSEINFSYTEVKAPFDGRIGRRLIDVDNLVGPGSGNEDLAILTQLDPMNIRFEPPGTELPEYLAKWPDTEIPVTVEFQTKVGAKSYQGVLNLVNNVLNPASSTFAARANFPNPDKDILPGLFGEVQVHIGTLKDQLVIPGEAIYSELQLQYVWVVGSDDALKRKGVTTIMSYQGMMLVTGLDEGDTVVVQGNPRGLVAGAKIKPTLTTTDKFIETQSKNAKAADARVNASKTTDSSKPKGASKTSSSSKDLKKDPKKESKSD